MDDELKCSVLKLLATCFEHQPGMADTLLRSSKSPRQQSDFEAAFCKVGNPVSLLSQAACLFFAKC